MVKKPPASAEDVGSIPGSGRSPGEPAILGQENPMDRGAWGATVRGVPKESDTT